MKKAIKSVILKAAAKAARKIAEKACCAASWWDCYQPKEPKIRK